MFLPVRLQAKGVPDSVHRRFGHAALGCDLPHTPMRAVFGLGLQCVATNCATRSSLIGRGRPGRNSSCRPATSCSRKRCRHLPTVALVNPNWRAISMFVFPEALSKIILARLTNPDGRERDLANDSNCSPCSAPNTNAAFGRPIAIGTSIVHKRCPCRQQNYCHLFMGHNTRCAPNLADDTD